MITDIIQHATCPESMKSEEFGPSKQAKMLDTDPCWMSATFDPSFQELHA